MIWGDLLSFEYGKPVKDKSSIDGDVPVYGTNGQIGTSHLPPLCNFPSFIVGRKGAYRGVHYSEVPFSVIDTAFYAKPLSDQVDLKWAYYKFLTYDINRMDSGSAIPSTDRRELYNIPVTLPSLTEQKRVVKILDSMNNKILANKEINKNLEQQAKELFRERFLSYTIVPDYWKLMTLGDVSDMSAGGDKPKTISEHRSDDCNYPVFSNGISNEGLYGYTNDYKISAESVTVSARGTIGFVCLRHIPFTPIVRLVTLVPRTDILSAKYLYLWLLNAPIHGTGTTQQQLTVPDFRKAEIIIPTETEMQDFTNTVNPLFQQIWANQDENNNLAELRDTLLPKLMSGEIDVSNIEL